MDSLGGLVGLLLIVGLLIAFIFLIRWLGAWMLRIDEVITLLTQIRNNLRDINESKKQ